MWIRILIISALLVFSSGTSWAVDPPVQGFHDLKEFVEALNKMPPEEFARRGALTGIEQIRRWQEYLRENADPKIFPLWNEKLRGLPTVGFVKNEHLWELSAPLVKKEVGFVKHVPYRPFDSVPDFFDAFQSEELLVFQARARVTPPRKLNAIIKVVAKQYPSLYPSLRGRLLVMQKIGFWKGSKLQFPENLVHGTDRGIGYHTDYGINHIMPIESVDELLEGAPAELRRRYLVLPKSKRIALIKELKQKYPESYEEVVHKLRSRNKVGFVRPGEEIELIEKTKGLPPNKLKDVLEHPKPRVQVKGYRRLICNWNSFFKNLLPSRK